MGERSGVVCALEKWPGLVTQSSVFKRGWTTWSLRPLLAAGATILALPVGPELTLGASVSPAAKWLSKQTVPVLGSTLPGSPELPVEQALLVPPVIAELSSPFLDITVPGTLTASCGLPLFVLA